MSNPRVIAATASAALIAGMGAGAAVYAVDITTGNGVTEASSSTSEQAADAWPAPQDDSTTVYRSPSDDHDDDDDDDDAKQFQAAPQDTQWNTGSSTSKNRSNTSKSS